MATGTLFIISAPSGAGKSSLIQAYLKKRTTAHTAVSISHTTRAPRVGESHGVHYYFIKPQEFEQMIEKGDFLEHAKVFDNYYGTSKSAIETHLNHGSDVFLDIDWQGARQVRAKMPNAKGIFILPPSLAELKNRLENRGQDSQEVIEKRMQKAKDEMSHYNEYDYLIVNDHFDTSVEQLNAIMLAERLNTAKQIESHQSLIEDLLK